MKAQRVTEERAQAGKGGQSGLYIPLCPPMPKALAKMIAPEPKKKGARPFSSPTKDAPATPPAKKTRKRKAPDA